MVLKLRKASSVVMDLTGVIATRAFMTNSPEAKEFMKKNLRSYLMEEWGHRTVRQDMALIRKKQDTRSRENHLIARKIPILVDHTKSDQEQFDSLVKNITWRMENEELDPDPGILASVHVNLNDWAKRRGLLKTPVYPEVAQTLTEWKKQGIKLYVTLGSQAFLQTVFTQTTQGDLLPLIDAHLNLMCYDGRKAVKNLASLPKMLDQKTADGIVYLTRLPGDAKVARKSKIPVVLVVREDFAPEADAVMKGASVESVKSMRSIRPRRSKSVVRTQSAAEQVAEESIQSKASVQSALEKSFDVEAVSPKSSALDEEIDLKTSSRININHLKEFPTITRLDEIVWV